jgi:CDGSH-type Zn-finger protein
MAKKSGQRWRGKELKKEEDINIPRQCLCGRSKIYPYCDGTHKIKTSDKYQYIKNEES